MQQAAAAPEILVMGDVLMDYQYWVRAMPVPGGDETILSAAQNSGGSGANTAAAMCAQKVACAFHGRLGDDALGDELAGHMREIGVDLSCLQRQGATGYTVTMIDPTGERTMFSFRGNEGYQPEVTPALTRMLGQVKILYISGYLLLDGPQAAFATAAAAAARQAGCLVMLDAAPTIGRVPTDTLNAFLAHTDVLQPNREELFALAGVRDVDAAVAKLLKTVPCVVVKLGGDGSRMAARAGFPVGGASLEKPLDCTVLAQKVVPVDTTGAGDSFNAGFMTAFLRGEAPESCLKAGNELAAQVIARRGAVSHFH